MKLEKNNKHFILAYLLVSLPFAAIGFYIDLRCGILLGVFAFSVLIIAIVRELTLASKLRKICNEVERAIHKAEKLNLSNYSEGDFSILVNQISKMIRKIVESEDKLKADKKLLADSIADISHQIRTPLTSINLLTSFIANPETDEETRAEYIAKLRVQLKRIDWLVNALLKISKLEAGTADMQKVKTPLKELVSRAAAPLLVPMELKGIEFVGKISGSAEIDLPWTAEALGNILKNCMEHTPSGGRISVFAEENAIYSEITVRDSGCGINKEDLPHIFERFYRGKNSSETSVGIGLAMSRMIISNQSGTITASNNPTGGAEFTIKFYKSVV